MALITGLAFFLNLFPGSLLQLLHTRWGLVLTQALFIALPPILAARWFHLDPRSLFPLRRPPAAALGAALLGAAALNYLLTVAGGLQERVLPTPEPLRRFYEGLFVYHGPWDFLLVLLVFAVLPAACEEILFRGFLQSGFMRIFESAPKGIAATSLVFAAFHLNPWIFPGVLVLGAFLGWLAYRAGSLLPAILAHALNNALSIALASGDRTPAAPAGSLPGCLGALALLAISLLMLRRPRRGRASGRML